MKKIISIALILILAASVLVGCKGTSGNGEENNGGSDEIVEAQTDSGNGKDDGNSISDVDSSSEESGKDPFDVAFSLIDHTADELISAIGEPNGSSYASSCMGSGQDGELYYNDFTVCTYLEDGVETVVDVYK